MLKLKKAALSILILLVVLVGSFFFLFGLKIPYVYRINKNSPDFHLEKIDLNAHNKQSDKLIYSINVNELKELINMSDSTYQLVYLYNLTCPSVVEMTSILKDSLFKLENTQVFPICVSDRTLCPRLKEQVKDPNIKKYVIDSKRYYANILDMYEHNNNSKMNFLNEIKPDTFFDGTYAILFKKWDNIEFVHDSVYYKKYWKEGMDGIETGKQFVKSLVEDIKMITSE